MFSGTYETGMKKLKKAEFMSDINSDTEDDETKKKGRKHRAKAVHSSEESFSEEETIAQLPSYPKVPSKRKIHDMQLHDESLHKMPCGS